MLSWYPWMCIPLRKCSIKIIYSIYNTHRKMLCLSGWAHPGSLPQGQHDQPQRMDDVNTQNGSMGTVLPLWPVASDGEGHPDLYRYGSFANSDGVPDTRLLPNKQLTGPVRNIRNIIEVQTTWNGDCAYLPYLESKSVDSTFEQLATCHW